MCVQFSFCVNSRPLVCEVRDVFQLCERPPLCLQHHWQRNSCCTLLGLQCAMSMYTSMSNWVACTTLQLFTWLGLAPNQMVMAALVIVLVGFATTFEHTIAVCHLMPLSAPVEMSCCFVAATLMLMLLAGLLLHATQCLGPEPASKGAAV
jgi:hypothetical protein